MSLGTLVVTAVRVEGRTKAEVARDYGVSRRWVHELCRRFEADGEAGLEPRSRRPRSSPHRTSEELEDEIVELRKELDRPRRGCRSPHDRGPPASAATGRAAPVGRHDLADPVPPGLRHPAAPEATAELLGSGSRPSMPNERWQADITHWRLADGTEVEILNVIDDHSRFLVGLRRADDLQGGRRRGDVPPSGCGPRVPGDRCSPTTARCSPRPRGGGRCALELETALGIRLRALPALPPADLRQGRALPPDAQALPGQAGPGADVDELQGQLDGSAPTTTRSDPTGRSAGARRPRRSRPGRRRRPRCARLEVPALRVRRDKVDITGRITLRHDSTAAPHRARPAARRHPGARRSSTVCTCGS